MRNPSKPTEVGRWWLPGTRKGDNEPPPARHQKPALDKGNRAHNTNVYPQRPDRMYLAYLDAGMFIMDISDKSKPKPICRFDNSPPYTGFTHTIVPLFDRGLVVMTDESTSDNAADWPKLIWILDARDENNLVPISTCPMPNPDDYKTRGGRFGAHNIHENTPRPDVVAVGPDHPRHVLQRRAARLRHFQRLSAEGSRHVRPAGTGAVEIRLDPAQRRVRGRARDRLHGRPLLRRAVHPGDGFLTALELFPSREAGPFGAGARSTRAGAAIPVTVITGFLGAGKTTLLQHFLATPEGRGTAVIVNEYGAVGIDDALIRGSSDQTTLLGNGCVCCVTRTDLQNALRRLVIDRERGEIPPFVRIVIETSGLADPAPILQTFSTDRALGSEFFMEVVVTVVDAATGLDTIGWSSESRKQVILADRIILSKTDLAEPDVVERAAGAAARAQLACRDRGGGERPGRSALPDRIHRRPASAPASSRKPSTPTASRAS